MKCPNCHKILQETAIRCKHCHYVLPRVRSRNLFVLPEWVYGLQRRVMYFFAGGRSSSYCPWTMVDVLIITLLIWVVIFHDPFHIEANLLSALRSKFFILTKEPRLYYFLNIYISTIILKALSLIFIVILVTSKKIPLSKTIFARGISDSHWQKWMPLYIASCIVFRMINSSNPLIPSLPFNSVFPDARLIGNITIIIAVLFVAPVVEEVVFRGFLYPALNKYMGVYPAVTITTVLFAVAHYPHVKDDPIFLITLLVLGYMLTLAKAKTGSTYLAIIMHCIYNFIVVGVGFIDYFVLRF